MEKQTSKNAGHVDHGAAATPMAHGSGDGHYSRFAWMLALSFVAMYVLMYAMVDRLGNAVPNINQFGPPQAWRQLPPLLPPKLGDLTVPGRKPSDITITKNPAVAGF